MLLFAQTEGLTGHGTFSARTGKVLGKPGGRVTLKGTEQGVWPTEGEENICPFCTDGP